MIAGTDAPQSGRFSGGRNTSRARIAGRVRLDAIDAISSATRNASPLMKASNDWGTLESGRLADLLVINGRPDQNIRETHNVEMVVKEGVILDRKQLKFNPARDPGFRTLSPVSAVP